MDVAGGLALLVFVAGGATTVPDRPHVTGRRFRVGIGSSVHFTAVADGPARVVLVDVLDAEW
jgi:hypothetical protein